MASFENLEEKEGGKRKFHNMQKQTANYQEQF